MKNMPNVQKILKRDALERMRSELKSGESLKSYFDESYLVSEDDLLPSAIEVAGEKPALSMPERDSSAADLENAIAIHSYYSTLNETQASDPRLWAYLSHMEFRKYAIARWGLDGTYQDLDEEKRAKAISYLLEHWFVGSNDRDLRRHAISRLWWAAHLTHAPWKTDPDFFGDLKNDNEYFYTRVLLSRQDIYQQVLERGMGRSNRILISVLDYLAENSEFAQSREKIRSLMKELNLAYGTKKIISLNRRSLRNLIGKIASDVKEETKDAVVVSTR